MNVACPVSSGMKISIQLSLLRKCPEMQCGFGIKCQNAVFRAKFSLKVIVLILFLPGEKSTMASSLLLS